jgi:hypothetical protein
MKKQSKKSCDTVPLSTFFPSEREMFIRKQFNHFVTCRIRKLIFVLY